MDPIFMDNIRGLCGTLNFKMNDDFLSPGGFVESDLLSFTDSYKVGECIAPAQINPCELSISVQYFYIKYLQ
jgi:hypothetical protein